MDLIPALAGIAWEWLSRASGGLAATLIIALAVGIGSMTLLFLGSAVVALERFARVARRPGTLITVGLVWAAILGLSGLHATGPQGSGLWTGEVLAVLPIAALSSVLAVGACMALFFGLGRLPSAWLVTGTLAWLGLGSALVLGGTGRAVYAAVPAAVAAGMALLLMRWRSRRGDAGLSDAEHMLRVLAGALAVGVALALAVPSPEVGLATAGAAAVGLFGGLVLLGLIPLAAAGLLDTRGGAEWFIAARYLVAKRRQTFISIITGICVVGIAVGVWLIITVLSVMNGFERTWRDEIIGNRAHFTVHSNQGAFPGYSEVVEAVRGMPEVVAASPYLDVEGMVRAPHGGITGVRLRGVDPKRVGEVTDLEEDLVEGSLDGLAPGLPGDPGIVVGSQLANAFGFSVGDPLLMISPFGGPQTPLGPAPRLKRFRVAGVFESSFFQYDEMFTYVHLAAAQDFRRVDDVVDGIEARTTDFYRSRQVAEAVQSALGFPFYTRDWKEFFPAFFQALKSERVMMFVLLTMIMVVAAFAIVATLVMMIMEKSGDIAILKAMGARDESIERIFAIEGTLIGLVGTALGVLAGISTAAQIESIQHVIETFFGFDALPASVYQFSTLPAQLDAGQIAVAVGIAMVLALGATLLPSRQGSRIDPVEALRYE